MYLFAGGVVLFIGALMVLRFREARAVQRRFKQAEEAEKRIVSNSEQRILDSKDRIALSQALQQKNHELLTEQTQLLREILSTLKQSRNP
jgi:hypothetical protein